ncbi:hypothetical protein XPR_4507, partial [Xanthomonas arboricola pv. pruni MAFF 301420]
METPGSKGMGDSRVQHRRQREDPQCRVTRLRQHTLNLKQIYVGSETMALTWAVSDGRAGNARQAEALAQALHSAPVTALHLQARAHGVGPHRACCRARRRRLDPASPGNCSSRRRWRSAAGARPPLATRLLRARGSQVVQLLDPRLDPRHWDLLVVPEHDALRG